MRLSPFQWTWTEKTEDFESYCPWDRVVAIPCSCGRRLDVAQMRPISDRSAVRTRWSVAGSKWDRWFALSRFVYLLKPTRQPGTLERAIVPLSKRLGVINVCHL